MPAKISANLSVQIPAGPNFSVSWAINADTYDRSTFTVPAAGSKTVQLQPSPAANVMLLAIAVPSGDYTGGVLYDFDTTVDPPAFALTGPQVIAGASLMANAPTDNGVIFKNPSAKDVSIDILVLRAG